MKTSLHLVFGIVALALGTACQSASSPSPSTKSDRTTPAGTARGVNPGNDNTETGVPESPAAHKSQ